MKMSFQAKQSIGIYDFIDNQVCSAVPEASNFSVQNELDPDLCFSFSGLEENFLPLPSTDDIQFHEFQDCNEAYANIPEDPVSEKDGKFFHSPYNAPFRIFDFEDQNEASVNAHEDTILPDYYGQAPVFHSSISGNDSGIQVYDFEDENEEHLDSQNDATTDFRSSSPAQCEKSHHSPSDAAISTADGELSQSNDSHSEQNKSTKSSIHKCHLCPFSSSSRYLLVRHAKTHDDKDDLQYRCDVCHKEFKHATTFRRHCMVHNGEKSHCCHLCSAEFASSGELVRHTKYKHTHEKAYKCTLCEYSAVEKAKVTRHMSCHTGERPHQCNDCSKAFHSIFNLRRHIRVHTGEKPYECDICSATFNQHDALKTHRTIHTDENLIYKCHICLSQFGRKCDLKNHKKKVHTSETPVHCQKCGDVFKDMFALKLHKKNHKRIACALCTFTCTSKQQLEKHSNKHTGLKPYKCDLCEASFNGKQQLKHHQILAHTDLLKPRTIKNKTKPIKKGQREKCNHCEKTFRSKAFLKRHMHLVKISEKFNLVKLQKDTAMKLDKVIDEILGKGDCDDTTVRENNEQVLNTDTEVSPQYKASDELNRTVVYDFDSDDLSVEASMDYGSARKKQDIETCFGFNEYF